MFPYYFLIYEAESLAAFPTRNDSIRSTSRRSFPNPLKKKAALRIKTYSIHSTTLLFAFTQFSHRSLRAALGRLRNISPKLNLSLFPPRLESLHHRRKHIASVVCILGRKRIPSNADTPPSPKPPTSPPYLCFALLANIAFSTVL